VFPKVGLPDPASETNEMRFINHRSHRSQKTDWHRLWFANCTEHWAFRSIVKLNCFSYVCALKTALSLTAHSARHS